MEDDDASEPAALIRAARWHADLSQRQLAAAADMHLTTLSRYESGARGVPFVAVARLLRAAGCDLVALNRRGEPILMDTHDVDRDRGGRHFPAHLDVRNVGRRRDWWGFQQLGISWSLLPAPEQTFDLSQRRRDERRRRLGRGDDFP